jgi:hypothetical protein
MRRTSTNMNRLDALRRLRPAGAALVALSVSTLAGCGGAPSAPSTDETFYLHGGGVIDKNKSWETYYPKFDRDKTARLPRFVGVGVLEGDVRLARPTDWTLRDADYTPEHRFISYQSPRQFTFSIYERVDPDRDTWTQVLRRYEKDTRLQGSDILAARMPVGTANSQGRAYLLHTKVRAKPDFDGYATEILVRNETRVLLIQIVHRQDIESIADEVSAALASMVVY